MRLFRVGVSNPEGCDARNRRYNEKMKSAAVRVSICWRAAVVVLGIDFELSCVPEFQSDEFLDGSMKL